MTLNTKNNPFYPAKSRCTTETQNVTDDHIIYHIKDVVVMTSTKLTEGHYRENTPTNVHMTKSELKKNSKQTETKLKLQNRYTTNRAGNNKSKTAKHSGTGQMDKVKISVYGTIKRNINAIKHVIKLEFGKIDLRKTHF